MSTKVTSNRCLSLQHLSIVALLCGSIGTMSCSTPDYPSDHKPKSRKTARQMEHYQATYGGPTVLGQPDPNSLYQPRTEASKPFTTLR